MTAILPVLNRGDLLFTALQSIDYPIEWVVVIDNSCGKNESVQQALHACKERMELEVVTPDFNLGYGASINWGFNNRMGPWLTMSNDMVFHPGCIERMVEHAFADPGALVIGSNQGLIASLIRSDAVAIVGTFDENFYPAYCEDFDWWRRVTLSGVRTSKAPEALVDHIGSQTIRSDLEVAQKNAPTHARNLAFYERKWGGWAKDACFQTPFNDPSWPINHWQIDPEHYEHNRSIWAA